MSRLPRGHGSLYKSRGVGAGRYWERQQECFDISLPAAGFPERDKDPKKTLTDLFVKRSKIEFDRWNANAPERPLNSFERFGGDAPRLRGSGPMPAARGRRARGLSDLRRFP